MFAKDSSSMKAWKELIASQRSQWDGGQSLDWREQPPRKKAKQQQQYQPEHQPEHQPPPPLQCAPGQQGGQSHKVVEKRRRDRMNQALSSLSQLIPAAYMRQGQSRVEKAEIIELAAQHLLALTSQLRKCQTTLGQDFPAPDDACCIGKFYQGFREGSKTAMAFLTEQEGFSTTDTLCCRLRAHLHALSQKHLPSQEKLLLMTNDMQQQPQLQPQQRTCLSQYRRDSTPSCSSTDDAAHSCGSGEASRDADEIAAAPGQLQGAQPSAAARDGGRAWRYPKSESVPAAAGTAAKATATPADAEQMLPGFVLHESGTYYLPLVVPPSALGIEICSTAGPDGISSVDKAADPLLHPISIPVNFRATRFIKPMMPPRHRGEAKQQ